MIKRLVEAGFSEYEAKAYETMLKQEPLAASEISRLGQIPQGRIYDVLSQLERKGFCQIYSGSIKKFAAVDPAIAFSDLIKQREAAIVEVRDLQSHLEKEFKNKKNHGSPLDYIQILTSKQSQVSKFDDLIKSSSQTLYSFNKKPYATGFLREMKEIIRASAPLRRIIQQGTSVKAIFEAEEEHTDLFIRMLQYYEEIGEEVRIAPKLPLKMLLSDGNRAMVSMRNNDAAKFKLTSMVVDHTDLTVALSELFELYWNRSVSLDTFLKTQKSKS